MKTKRFIAIASALAASLALPIGGTAKGSEFLAAQSQSGTTYADLIVRIEGLETTQGQLMVGLYDSESAYENDSEFEGGAFPIERNKALIRFEDIPVGHYAIKVFHDEDMDGRLSTGALGIPSEDYGFSNNASDPFSAPEWRESRFALPKGEMIQTIDLS